MPPGLVVAPGFIDLHAHGQDPESSRYQARDGVTTAMELEIGVYPVDAWYAVREGQALIHFGATVSHQGARRDAFGVVIAQSNAEGTLSLGRSGESDEYLYDAASADELRRLGTLMGRGTRPGRARVRLRHQLHAGGQSHRAPPVVRRGGGASGAGLHPPPVVRCLPGRRRHRAVPGGGRERGRHRRVGARRAHEQQRRRVSPGRARADPGRRKRVVSM